MSASSELIYKKAWNLLQELALKNEFIILDNSNDFFQDCLNLEKNIISQYMVKNAQLDRHKLAGVIAVCAPKYIMSGEELTDEQVFLGKYICSLQVALSLVENDLNADLKNAGLISNSLRVEIVLPNPSVCKRSCIDSEARMLYWQEEKEVDGCIRALVLANTLFLYEEFTVLMYDVDVAAWKLYKQSDTPINSGESIT